MHHAHYWMNDRVKNRFENVLFRYCDVVLCGHEHNIQSHSIEKAGSRLIYLTGGELSNQGEWGKSEFYIDVIDTDEIIISSNQFIWNMQREIYQKKNEKTYSFTNKNGNTSLELDQDFLSGLKNDSVNSLTDNVFDYYVFPDIELVDDNSRTESRVFVDLESFIELICEKSTYLLLTQKILETYGINSMIILFVTYLTDNLYLIRSIIDCTISYMQDRIAFNSEKANISYLASINGQIPMEAPSQKDREKNSTKEQENDKAKIEKYEDSQIVAKDYFETDMDDSEELMNQILRSVTLLDITSKCLPGFEHRMKKEDKEKVISLIFQLPARIFHKWAYEVGEVQDEMVQFFGKNFVLYILRREIGEKLQKMI